MTSAYDLKALLDWYEAMGVDCALEEAPQDRFVESDQQKLMRQQRKARAQAQHKTSSPPSGARRPSPAHAPSPSSARPDTEFASPSLPQKGAGQVDLGVEEAQRQAASAKSLTDLRQLLLDFDGCSLKYSAKNLVFGAGNPQADIMFVGEAPGRDEDLRGIPFIGRAGQLLDKMMAAINLDRAENAYITNILPWRPPGNRKPSLDETNLLHPFIHRHIELVNPKILVFLGGTSAQHLLRAKDGIMRLRGRWKSYAIGGEGSDIAPRKIPAMATFHPAFLLRSPAQKRAAWQDWLDVAAKRDELKRQDDAHL